MTSMNKLSKILMTLKLYQNLLKKHEIGSLLLYLRLKQLLTQEVEISSNTPLNYIQTEIISF